MKKVLKVLGVLVGIFVALLGIASLALHIFLPPEKAKALVLKQLTTHLKRQVTVGQVNVGILSGLSLADLKISESPDFSKGTFISSDHFSIHLALLPLIFRKVEVKQVVLDHPVIQVIRSADGKTFNFSDLLDPQPQPPSPLVGEGRDGGTLRTAFDPPPSPTRREGNGISFIPEAYAASAAPTNSPQAEPSFALLVSNAQINKGVVHFIDRSPAKQSMDIDQLDLKLKDVSLKSPFTLQTSLRVKAQNVIAQLKLAGEADLATDSFKIKNCTLSSGGSTIELAGKASRLRSSQPTVDLTLDVKEFKLATLSPFMTLPPALKLEGPILANARIKGDQKKMDLALKVDLENVQVMYGKQFNKPAKTPMLVSLKGDLVGLQDLNLAELRASLGSLQLSSHGKILAAASTDPQISLHLESNTFPVHELLERAAVALPKDVAVSGKAQFSADVSGTQTSSHIAAKVEGKGLDIKSGETFHKPAEIPMRVSFVGEWLQHNALVKGKKTAKAPEQTLTIQNLTTTIGSSEIIGTGSVSVSAVPMRFQLSLKSKSLSLQEIARLSPWAARYGVKGTAALDARTSGTADNPLINGTLTLQDASLHYEQSELTQLATSLTFTHQDVNIPKLTGKLNGSDLSLKMVGRQLTTKPDIHVEATIAELDLGKLLPATPAAAPVTQGWMPSFVATAWAAPAPGRSLPPAKLSGQLNVGHIKHEFYDAKNLDCTWNLTDVTPDLSRVSGQADLKQGAGILKDVEKLAAMSKSAQIALQPIITLRNLEKKGVLKGIGVPSLQKIPFSGILGDYALRSGLMEVKAFNLMGADLNVNATGTIGLPEPQPLNLRVVMKLAAGSVGGDLGQLTADESGRPTLPFTITGTSSQPNVKADLHDIGRKAIQKYGGDLLKGLGLGGQSPPAKSPPSSEENLQSSPPDESAPPQPKSVDDIQKALKNIFR